MQSPLSQPKVFIFDFDGTICDSFHSVIEIVKSCSEELGIDPTQRKQVEDHPDLRTLTMRELLKTANIPIYRIPQVVRKIRKELHKSIDQMVPFSGMSEALTGLKKRGHSVGILTSNSKENVARFAKSHNLASLDFMYSGSSLFGKDKVIKRLLKGLKVEPANAIYVGDETRDIEASKAAGIQMIAVAWGFNSKELLKSHHPDFLLDTPAEFDRF